MGDDSIELLRKIHGLLELLAEEKIAQRLPTAQVVAFICAYSRI